MKNRIIFDGLDILVSRSPADNKLVIEIITEDLAIPDRLPDDDEGIPDIRVWVNEALVYDKNWSELL